MKTVKLEIDVETAKTVLSDFDKKIAERMRERSELDETIAKLEAQAKSLRTQLLGVDGAIVRAVMGDNRTKIREYLATIPENKGARMVEIRKATGIGTSSVAFTLKNHDTDFVADRKIWKLKN
jgi:hypothetical protein